jgi:hypothetical protein
MDKDRIDMVSSVIMDIRITLKLIKETPQRYNQQNQRKIHHLALTPKLSFFQRKISYQPFKGYKSIIRKKLLKKLRIIKILLLTRITFRFLKLVLFLDKNVKS